MRLFRVAFPEGTSFPLHTHPSPLLVFIQQGKIGLVKPNGKTHVFMPGDTFVIGLAGPSVAAVAESPQNPSLQS